MFAFFITLVTIGEVKVGASLTFVILVFLYALLRSGD